MKLKLLLVCMLSATISIAQEYKEMISSGSYSLKEIQESAENYFTIKGKGKGSGYKQFKRWEYNAIRLQDEQGHLKNELSNIEELNQLNKINNKNGLKSASITGSWEALGPVSYHATSGYNPGVGRITSISVDNRNPNHIIVGSETGGVWRSGNKGKTWTPLCDNFSNMRVYALAIDPTNSNVFYWGSSNGIIYKSNDAGASWTKVATFSHFGNVNKLLIDPTNPSKVFATCSYNGIFKSTDGGRNWQKVTNDYTGLDIEFKPGDYNTIYATGSQFHKSNDGGKTWSTITGTFGSGVKMIGVSPDEASTIYVLEEKDGMFGGLYVSTDNGSNFTKKNHADKNYFGYSIDADDSRGQAPRDMAIAVSPHNINEVHIAGILTFRSIDGGSSFTATSDWIPYNASYSNIGYCHADVDDMAYFGNELYVVTDGGVFVCENTANVNADYYKDLSTGMGIHQFYRIGLSNTDPVIISGGAQDNGTSAYVNGSWKSWLGADGMESFVDKNNHSIFYGTMQEGILCKSEDGANSFYYVTPLDNNENELEGNWVTPFEQDPIEENRIYAGYNQVYKSDDGGNKWIAISQIFSGNLNHLKIAASNNKVMYVALGYELYKTTTGEGMWSKISGFTGYINSIAIHPTDPNRVAIATTSSNKIYITTDGGDSWQVKNTGLPNFSALCLVWDKVDNGLYLGMDYGVYYINDNLSAWQLYNNLLPNVMINELEINFADNKLYAATYGRGLWRTDLYKNTATSAKDLETTVNYNIFPNPASSILNIQWKEPGKKAELRIFNVHGKLVYYIKEADLNNFAIRTDDFTNGIYFIRINSSKGIYTQKIVIKK